MTLIKTGDLIIKFQYALDNKWGYILNTWHTKWSQALQNSKVNYMENKYGSNWKNSSTAKTDSSYTAAMYGSRWVGKYVTDCSGLFYWAFKELGGYMYHGSNTMWNKYCTSKGKLSQGKRSDGQELKPGTAVFVLKNGSDRSHVGLYIGNGKVIEASGTQVGVITSDITNKKWAEWGELKGVDYNTSSTVITKPSEPEKTATVNDVKVALRSEPSTKSTVLLRVDKGETVEVEGNEWTKVTYKGKQGYMMTKFLDFN